MQILSSEDIAKLVGAPRPNQTSKFLVWYEDTLLCASRGCRSPTFIKVQGMPKCMMHALRLLDEICNEQYEQLQQLRGVKNGDNGK